MRKKAALFLILSLALTGCRIQLPFQDAFGQAALQVASTPKADVFLNDQPLGQTPINNKKLKSGTYTLKLQAKDASWTGTIQLQNATVTVVNRELPDSGSEGAGDVISLERGDGIAVIGTPENADVYLDQKQVGKTPLYLPDIAEGVHEFAVEKEGFNKRTLKLKATKGYKLIINTNLAQVGSSVASNATPAASSTPEPSSSKAAGATPTAKALPTQNPTTPQTYTKVQVKQTPTGFLRVRSGPSTANAELFQVTPGDELPFTDEQNGWVKISKDGKEGWASLQYLTKIP